MRERRRTAGRAVALLSAGCVISVASVVRPAAVALALPILVAVVWGAAPQAIDAWCARSSSTTRGTAAGTVTYVISATAGDPASSRIAILAAAAAAPTIVVTTDEAVGQALGPLPAHVVVGPNLGVALATAADLITTDAALVMSARSFADHDAVRRAAGLIRDGASWVVGRSQPFNADGFAPLVRDRLGRRMRAAARRRGLAIWEPGATVVRPDLLRSPDLDTRPLGAMLRRGRHAANGLDVREILTVVAEPVDARSYWQVSVARRRASAADLSDAAGSETGVPRALALGLLIRELDGVRLAIWLVTPWLLTLSADGLFRISFWRVLPLLLVPALLRWWALRALHRVRLHPLEDALALAYDAPGSVLAVPSAFTRRVRPSRPWLPSQPLAVAALVFAGVAVLPLFDAGTTARRSATVGLALTELGLLWLVTMRAIFQRNWSRGSYRVRAQLPVRIDGRSLRTRDMSPGGLGVVGHVGWMAGTRTLDVEIALPDGGVVTGTGTVANRWRRGDEEVVGLALTVEPACQGPWLIQLERSAHEAAGGRGRRQVVESAAHPNRERPARRWLRWALAAGVGAVTALALAVACLAAIGMRPLVVRSGSMRPALQVGDVVLVEDVEARDLRVGDIATLVRPDTGDTLTHRVIAVEQQPGGLAITTRGDANADDEITTVAADDSVGRVRWRVPAVGRIAAWAGHRSTRLATAVVVGGLIVGAALIARRRRTAAGRSSPAAARS